MPVEIMTAPAASERLIVAIPIFNDWESLDLLLQDLDGTLHAHGIRADVLILNDGSTVPPPQRIPSTPRRSIGQIDILHLRRNLGHQRAIAIGLTFIQVSRPCEAVLVMDGDGEDRPSDVPVLVETFHRLGATRIVFAERAKRSESTLFRFLYVVYRLLHRALTGISVRVGNFSLIPFHALTMLVVVSELWTHYAAAVFKARLPYDAVPTIRGRRLAGTASMNFVALVVHGLSALSVFGDVIGVRLLVAAITVILLGGGGVVAVLVTRLTTNLAIPGWATFTTGLLLLILLQVAALSLLLTFIILSARATVTFIPIRDYQYFIKDVTRSPSE
jgi:polyisoprenyl-phosphate glycosyltransferase